MNSILKDFMKGLFLRVFQRKRFAPRSNFLHLVLAIFSMGVFFGVFIFFGIQFLFLDISEIVTFISGMYNKDNFTGLTASNPIIQGVALYSMLTSLFK